MSVTASIIMGLVCFYSGVFFGIFIVALCKANDEPKTKKADPINTIYDYGR